MGALSILLFFLFFGFSFNSGSLAILRQFRVSSLVEVPSPVDVIRDLDGTCHAFRNKYETSSQTGEIHDSV